MRDLKTTQERYLDVIAVKRRPNTVINSRTATNGFIRYLEGEHPGLSSFAELERTHLESWLRYLAGRPLKQSTRRNAIIKVRVFIQDLQEDGWEEAPRVELFRRGDLPPEDRHLPRPLSPEVDRALQDELRRHERLIPKALLLLRRTGLRAQELLDLRVDALAKLGRGEWSLRVPLGKLHSERVIPVDRETAKLFTEMRQLGGSPADEALAHFLLIRRSNGRRYTREAFRHALAAAEKAASLPEHPTPHRLRHTYATELLRAGIRLPFLMKLLGHRTIGMTMRYVQVTDADVQRAYMDASITLAKLRYGLESIRPRRRARTNDDTATRQTILQRLDDIVTELERLRRDTSSGQGKAKATRLERLVQRLRRLIADLDAAIS